MVNDRGLYAVMARGVTEMARDFQDWIFGDVMFTIQAESDGLLGPPIEADVLPLALKQVRHRQMVKQGLIVRA